MVDDIDETFAAPWNWPAKSRPRTGNRAPLAAKRRNMRTKELREVHRFAAAEGVSWRRFVERLTKHFGDRDIFNPADVTPTVLGSALRLTLARKMEIEEKATERGRANGFTRRDGRLYRFRLYTLAPHDVTAEEAERAYKRRSNAATAARRKAERAGKFRMEARTMSTQQQTSFDSYAEAIAAQKARTRAQADAIYVVLDNGERTIAELMLAVRNHPAWRDCFSDHAKFRQAIVDRLAILRSERRITDRYKPRPQGGSLRFVNRRI